jgi:hypothetical protein
MQKTPIKFKTPPLSATPYATIETTAGRMGLVTCLHCGAALLLGDVDADGPGIHEKWHAQMAAR